MDDQACLCYPAANLPKSPEHKEGPKVPSYWPLTQQLGQWPPLFWFFWVLQELRTSRGPLFQVSRGLWAEDAMEAEPAEGLRVDLSACSPPSPQSGHRWGDVYSRGTLHSSASTGRLDFCHFSLPALAPLLCRWMQGSKPRPHVGMMAAITVPFSPALLCFSAT